MSEEKQTITAADVGEVPAEIIEKKDRSPRVSRLRAELEEERKPLVEERDKCRARLDELTQNDEVNALRARIKQINSVLGPIENELAAIIRASGGRSIAVEGGVYEKKGG